MAFDGYHRGYVSFAHFLLYLLLLFFCNKFVGLCVNFFSVKHFSATIKHRTLKFGKNLGNDKFYCVRKKQPHMVYHFLFCPISFFPIIFSKSSNFVYTMRTTKCIAVNIPKVLRFIFAFFFYFSLFSHSNVMNMKTFVEDFSGTYRP